MKPASLSYARPATLSDAVNNLHTLTDQCRVIAGGQSLGPMLNLRLAQPKHLVDISQLTDLRGASVEDGILAIGACVTHAEEDRLGRSRGSRHRGHGSAAGSPFAVSNSHC